MADLPDRMRAVEISTPGGPEVLKLVDRPVPALAAGEVLVKVSAAGVNRPDLLQRAGAYPPPEDASDLPGLEVAGTIAAVGEGVSRWAGGEAVVALANGGGYADYCAAPGGQVLPLPDGLDMVAGAAVPETYFTVWSNVFDRGAARPGETLLVHGGASGIGTTAIQLAKASGMNVVVTAGTDEKCEACRELGADHAINYRTQDFVDEVKAFTGGSGVDIILDMVAGDYAQRNLSILAEDGRLVFIGVQGGPKAELKLVDIMRKRLTVTGSTLRPRTAAYKASVAQALERNVWPRLSAGEVRPIIDRAFPLEDAAQAHAYLEAGEHVGKVVLTLS